MAAIGEAKSGEQLGVHHLNRLEFLRESYGPRATDAKLLLFGASFDERLVREQRSRSVAGLIDFDRLYDGD